MKAFSKFNREIKYLLAVIDVFSKYGWLIPLKDKKGTSIASALKTIFKERKPGRMWVDKGKEFYKLLNLSTPFKPSDAATKKYVDNIKSISNESINRLSRLYNTLDKTQEENKEEISKTQEEISKTQQEINEKINETQQEINKIQEEINKIQEEINEKIDNALCDAPDPVNPQDGATKEYIDKINSLLNASIIKLSQLYITLSGTVDEYKEKN